MPPRLFEFFLRAVSSSGWFWVVVVSVAVGQQLPPEPSSLILVEHAPRVSRPKVLPMAMAPMPSLEFLDLALPPVLAQPESLTACFKTDVDFWGKDLAVPLALEPSAEACQIHCQQIETCEFFTWVQADHGCYLKFSDSEQRPTKGTTSGPRVCSIPSARARAEIAMPRSSRERRKALESMPPSAESLPKPQAELLGMDLPVTTARAVKENLSRSAPRSREGGAKLLGLLEWCPSKLLKEAAERCNIKKSIAAALSLSGSADDDDGTNCMLDFCAASSAEVGDAPRGFADVAAAQIKHLSGGSKQIPEILEQREGSTWMPPIPLEGVLLATSVGLFAAGVTFGLGWSERRKRRRRHGDDCVPYTQHKAIMASSGQAEEGQGADFEANMQRDSSGTLGGLMFFFSSIRKMETEEGQEGSHHHQKQQQKQPTSTSVVMASHLLLRSFLSRAATPAMSTAAGPHAADDEEGLLQ